MEEKTFEFFFFISAPLSSQKKGEKYSHYLHFFFILKERAGKEEKKLTHPTHYSDFSSFLFFFFNTHFFEKILIKMKCRKCGSLLLFRKDKRCFLHMNIDDKYAKIKSKTMRSIYETD